MTACTPTDILMVLFLVRRPIKAKEIAKLLSTFRGEDIARRDVNSVIYGHLLGEVVQDEFFRWSLGSSSVEDVESDTDELGIRENVVNLDSIVRVKYFNGEELQIGFKKGEDLFSDGIKYISRQSPLALSIRGRQVGDVCTPPSSEGRPVPMSCEILEIN